MLAPVYSISPTGIHEKNPAGFNIVMRTNDVNTFFVFARTGFTLACIKSHR